MKELLWYKFHCTKAKYYSYGSFLHCAEMNNTCDMMFTLYYFSTTGYQLVGKKENNKVIQQIYLPFTIQNNGQIKPYT